jgi:hypothetical protein
MESVFSNIDEGSDGLALLAANKLKSRDKNQTVQMVLRSIASVSFKAF